MDPKSMASIFSLAQKIASDIKVDPQRAQNGTIDMSNIISQVTNSVSKTVTPDFVDKIKNNQSIDFEEEGETFVHREKVEPIVVPIELTIRDLYHGKVKKINVKTKVFDKKGKLETVKTKHHVKIEKGMVDEEVIVFKNEGDCHKGKSRGDIHFVIKQLDDDNFERDGNNLVYNRFVSLPECYLLDFCLRHPNDNVYRIMDDSLTFNCTNPIKIVPGLGMPVYGSEEDEYGDLLIVLNYFVPFSLDENKLKLLQTMCPREIEEEGVVEVELPDIDGNNVEVKAYNLEDETETEDEGEDDDDEDEDDEDDDDEDVNKEAGYICDDETPLEEVPEQKELESES